MRTISRANSPAKLTLRARPSTFSYDVLGRMIQRVEPDMTSIWAYDGVANGIGKLNYEAITA